MKTLTALIAVLFLSGCSTTQPKGEEIINMLVDNGCKIKSYTQKRGDNFRAECFEVKSGQL